MAVTVADVMTILQAQVKDITTYYVFGHEILVSAVTAIISDITAQTNEYWDAATLANKAALIDQLIKYDVAMEVMGTPGMGQQMISGVTWSGLDMSVTKGSTFTEQVKETREWLNRRREIIRRMLQDNTETDANTDIGADYWTDGLDKFASDTIAES